MAIYRLGDAVPVVPDSAFVADQAVLIGAVNLGPHSSVWPQAVVRADNEPIEIGAESNIQEGAVLHVDPGQPLVLGQQVTVGHQATLHGCRIEAGVLIGIHAVVLNGAVIGAGSLVGAGALVTEGKRFAPGSLILGAPARVVRALEAEEIERIRLTSAHYVTRAATYRQQLHRLA